MSAGVGSTVMVEVTLDRARESRTGLLKAKQDQCAENAPEAKCDKDKQQRFRSFLGFHQFGARLWKGHSSGLHFRQQLFRGLAMDRAHDQSKWIHRVQGREQAAQII